MWQELLRRGWQLGLSAFIASILLFQAYAVPGELLGSPLGGYYWPIMDYPMYSTAKREGDHVLYEYRVELELADASRIDIDADDVGLRVVNFHRLARQVIQDDPAGFERFARFSGLGEDLRAVRVYSPEIIVTRSGPAAAPRLLLGEAVRGLGHGKQIP